MSKDAKAFRSIDVEVWVELKEIQPDNGPDLLLQLRDLYLKLAPELMGKITVAVAKGDALGVYRESHSLKSSSAQIGAFGMTELCIKIEKLGKFGKIEGVKDFLGEMESEFTNVKRELVNITDEVADRNNDKTHDKK